MEAELSNPPHHLFEEAGIDAVIGVPGSAPGEDRHDVVTDARPDTGGLSGATPHEAVTWGKVDPTRLPDAVVCYTDTTIAMPILVTALSEHAALIRKRQKPVFEMGPELKFRFPR